MKRDDFLDERLMLPKPYSRRVYYSGMFSIISVAVSMYLGMYAFSVLSTVVLVNSINYWRDPVKGWRRNLDMVCVFAACMYQMNVSFRLANQWYFIGYWTTLILALSSYSIARRYGRVHRNPDLSSWWHMGIHIFGNISNVILYYGFSLQMTGSADLMR
ncbi:MAG: hypothetical protein GY801_21825 [bacterium]|nr:hypothetical protein [bacterium]